MTNTCGETPPLFVNASLDDAKLIVLARARVEISMRCQLAKKLGHSHNPVGASADLNLAYFMSFYYG